MFFGFVFSHRAERTEGGEPRQTPGHSKSDTDLWGLALAASQLRMGSQR
jgi:hypothetical protein